MPLTWIASVSTMTSRFRKGSKMFPSNLLNLQKRKREFARVIDTTKQLFFYNIPICLKAFLNVMASKIMRRDKNVWVKTLHSGSGNCYIVN